ncbi:Ubiquitin fusion degradation protein 4 [Paramarasmius palmivorus]|uniref:HECT-type E3 ubiquitin transferase n=1 Tax=Paramarasmius palmivorus TaxID=297713 RepID=A0AAW0DYI2_9AGAR
MDLPSSNQQEATASSSNTAPDTDSAETKTLRSSARVKAAKQKSQGKDTSAGDSGSRKRTRDPKGKAKQVADEPPKRRTRRNTTNTSNPPLTINEPVKDPKGKKRAAPEVSSDEDHAPSSSSKRPRTRSQTTTNQSTDMPRKTKSTTAKGKMAVKAKAMAAAGSSQQVDPDIEMADAQHDFEQEDHEEVPMDEDEDGSDHDEHPPHEDDDDGGDDDDHDDGEDEDGGISGLGGGGGGSAPGGLDEAAALAIFGDYRQFGSYMMSLSSRLKTMLNNIKMTADPTTRLLTLQELSELLSISTEDTLAGSFQVEQFVKELVKILGGRGDDDDEGDDGDGGERDDDLAAALALSGGPAFQGDENLESQVLAARCLANLMEALPGVAHTVVYHGAIPVLCSKLIEISYIDLAEQTLSTMEKISEEFPSAIVREGGLSALLNYLDFFSIAVQRTALQAASNCCRNISSEHFPQIRGVWPIIRNCLTYSDQRLVEFTCLCVIRVIDSYHRASVENLESLVDTELIRAVLQLLLPASGSPMIAPNTFTLLLRALATSARASPKITVALLEADIVDTLYQILTGVLPTAAGNPAEQGGSAQGQGLGGGVADMTVMDNLAHRPKDQIEETLGLISELMPPLPKDGVFDYKSYTEKALARMIKAKAKADRAAARAAAQAPLIAAGLIAPPAVSTPDETPAEAENAAQDGEAPVPGSTSPTRTEILQSKAAVVGRFMQLTVPILIDVYAASVNTPVRVKALTGLLKAVSFLDAEGCQQVLKFVPVASFASSILSSKDQPQLVIGGLQLVDLLLGKDPSVYKPAFRREGVFHEIEQLATRSLISSKSKEKADKDKDKDSSEATSNSDSTFSTPAPPSHAPTIPGYKKLSSLALDPDDAITLRSRIIKFKYLTADDQGDGESSLTGLKALVDRIDAPNASEKELTEALWDLANLFASPHTSISSFEMIQSGLVDGLLRFTMDNERKGRSMQPLSPVCAKSLKVSVSRRKELLVEALLSRRNKALSGSQTPFTTFVKKLQESLTRLESFEVVTVSQSSDDSKRSSPSLLARQLRLRLVADEESGVPRTLHNIVVSIHAIATFQALHDYLRPRVAGLLGGSGSRLSGMLAALAASGFAGPSRASASTLANASDLPTSTPPESSGTGGATITRRRSQRLSAKMASTSSTDGSGDTEASVGPSASSATAEASNTDAPPPPPPPEPAPSDTLVADFSSDEEVDAEVFEDDDDPDNSIADKTVNLSVAEDGSKVEAQTPDGTRVATPAQRDGPSSSLNRPESSSRPSYAAALKQKPSDWHLEFAMDDHILPLDLTIYGAIHQHEMRKKSGPLQPSMLWQGIYTVKFKKVPGPAAPSETDAAEAGVKARSSSPTLSCLADDTPHAKILRLLRVLHKLNTLEAERSAFGGEKRNLPETAFVNNKLTAKLTRQLEEPMIVASSCLPDWALDLPQHFPFLFPFATRYNFLQSTSFGYARLILKWQSQQSRGQDSSRRDDGIGFLGRLHRQKVRISRKHILESAVKVFELYGSSSSVLEVEYFEEVGTGLGPTLEFYSLVSKEFARKDLKIWRDADHTNAGTYVNHPSGLYPAPLEAEDIASDGGQKKTHIFRVIGQFVAKAMLDSRIIDLSFNKIFLKLILGEDVPLTIASLKVVDVELANSLAKLLSIAAGNTQPPTDKVAKKIALLESVSVEDLALDFTLPGYDIELRPGGKDIAVTAQNAHEYVQEVLDLILGKGAQLQAKAFREGFSKVFPISDLQPFSVEELVMLFGNGDEDWSIETLSEVLKADHGFHPESRAIRDLVEIMADYDPQTRREYLQFITGSPKLPIGGFRGLNPPFTVVRKPHEAPLTADDYLPSVMTCVNYLKLPEYSSKAVMKEKIRIAIKEGVGSFHLS